MVTNSLQHGEIARGIYRLYAWVIMPNHLHTVLKARDRTRARDTLAQRPNGSNSESPAWPNRSLFLARLVV
jgi:hypothetical protein